MVTTKTNVDFSNTKIAFSYKTNKELKGAARLFRMMNQPWMVKAGSRLGLWATKFRLPFSETIIKKTIFEQFVGGTTLLGSMPVINKLYAHNILTVLDYGAEGKDEEQDLNYTMNENIRAIEFALQNKSTPVISTKISGLVRNEILEKVQRSIKLSSGEMAEYQHLLKRLDAICHKAHEHHGVGYKTP